MNPSLILAALSPIVQVGGPLTNWLISLALIALIVWFVVWIVTKFAGPPSIPQGFAWVIWIVVGIALLIFLFAALGIALP
jgi:hypothetical protein